MKENDKNLSLPENAHRELKPGESYQPLLKANEKPFEVTPYSVTVGLLMTILFSAAAAYLGLKVGQVFEAAIPIAIIAVGLTGALKKQGGPQGPPRSPRGRAPGPPGRHRQSQIGEIHRTLPKTERAP